MVEPHLTAWLQRLPVVVELLAFRAQPLLAYALVTGRLTPLAKLAALASYGVLLALVVALEVPLARVASSVPPMLWFALCAFAVHRMPPLLAGGVLSKGAVFVLCTLLFLLLPALLSPPAFSVAALVLGWDMVLRSFSYCCDTAPRQQRPPLGQALFFLLVNPTLVYAARGRDLGRARLSARGLGRAALGLLTLGGYCAIEVARTHLGSLPQMGAYAAFVAVHAGTLLSAFMAHSGLASLHIGTMRLLGHELPERYDWPLLARSPRDFWQRWNIWIGTWARRYLFYPLARRMQRRGWRRFHLDTTTAAMLTFGGIGLLHDLFGYLQYLPRADGVAAAAWTRLFALFGLTFVAWLAAARLLRRPRSAVARVRWRRPVFSFASWALFMHCLLWSIWVVSPDGGGELAGWPP